MTDLNPYRQIMADPSCTLEDALMAYARDNIDVARQMTNQHATVSEPMDYQELMNYLSDLDPIAILAMGHGSPQFKSDAYWFTISWDDEIIPLTDEEADEWFLDNFKEAVVPLIIAGSIPFRMIFSVSSAFGTTADSPHLTTICRPIAAGRAEARHSRRPG